MATYKQGIFFFRTETKIRIEAKDLLLFHTEDYECNDQYFAAQMIEKLEVYEIVVGANEKNQLKSVRSRVKSLL